MSDLTENFENTKKKLKVRNTRYFMKTADGIHFAHNMKVVRYRHQIIGENKRIINKIKVLSILSNQP